MKMDRSRSPKWLLFGALVLSSVDSFQPVPFRGKPLGLTPVRRRTLLWYTETTATTSDLSVRTDNGVNTDYQYSSLPPWLSQYDKVLPSHVQEQINWLEYALMENGFLVADIHQVISAVERVASEDVPLAAGIVDFLRLLLSLRQDETGSFFVTTPVLLASVIHYTECVAARRQGMPDLLRDILLHKASVKTTQLITKQLPPGIEVLDDDSALIPAGCEHNKYGVLTRPEPPMVGVAKAPEKTSVHAQPSPYEKEVELICNGAARIKRAECLAHAVLQHNRVTPSQASRLRDLYLMCMDQDWRSLALRVVACLYRLEGLMRIEQNNFRGHEEYGQKSPDVVQTAREAMRIYAPLAQRLGMHRLKAMIEERAFRLQYRRQYRAVSALYHETGEAMQSVSEYLSTHLRQILQNDEVLTSQLDSFQVMARVKEPYSFWRKLLQKKVKGLLKASNKGEDGDDKRTLSITQVNDVVALRVILKARRQDPEETDDHVRARERMLCYYVQHLIQHHWPATDEKRIKDYIANPKPNGYQSLHHTSLIASRGFKFPFEVQVRSAEMHEQAEYGVSAHWDYKLASRPESLPCSEDTLVPALPRNSDENLGVPVNLASEESQPLVSAETSLSTKVAGSYVDALEIAQKSMLRQQVYVFILGDGNEGNEQGELISVPVNTSIGDAIEEIEDIVPSKVQVWKNGSLAQTGDKLENGDVMMIAV